MSLEDVRATAQTVANHARNDLAYRAQLLANPLGMLVEAGIPRQFAQQYLDTETDSDVHKHGLPENNGDGPYHSSCFTTFCIFTCD